MRCISLSALEDFAAMKPPLLKLMLAHNVRGTVLLAAEGINGTISAKQAELDKVISWLQNQPGLQDLSLKWSTSERAPFKRSKVKLKKEIVTMGVEGIDPNETVGTYLQPRQWNQLLDDPDILLVDTRNGYEVEVGTFENAINPQTESFRDFPRFAEEQLSGNKNAKIAMFCTGGIRCEKSTALLKGMGFNQVYHLQGGILKYLEEIPQAESKWQGECFVFDDRVTVDHQLNPGSYDQCHACRLPITDDDKQHPKYKKGISCPRCFDRKNN